MIVNKTTIAAVFQTLHAAFNKAFAEALNMGRNCHEGAKHQRPECLSAF